MNRRQFLTASAVVSMSGLLAGCAKGSEGRPGTIAFFNDVPTWSPGFAATDAALRKLAGAILRPQSVPGTSSYQQVIQSQLQTKNPPDICKWGSGYRMQDLARTGALHDMDAAWDGFISRGWAPRSLRSIFEFDGKTYGIPLQQGYYVMFYNVPLFKKLGLARPTTWAEFIHACEALKAHGVTPIGTTQVNSFPIAYWMSPLAVSVDADWYARVCVGQAKFTDAGGVHLMTVWQQMIRKGYFTPADSNSDDFPAQLAKGTIGMYPGAASWSSQSMDLTGMKPGAGYDMFILPPVEGNSPKAVITETAGLIVPKKAPRLKDALHVAVEWLSPQVQKPWAHFLSGSSANPHIAWSNGPSQRIKEQVQHLGVPILNRYYEASPPALVDGNLQDLGGFMADPSSPMSVLESMQRRADTEWRYWRKEA